MIRVNIGFIKNQAMPLLAQTRPDLMQYCNDRAHTHDFVRELLNIYFRKPTNNMKFSGLDISPNSLVSLEPLRQTFEQAYTAPQNPRTRTQPAATPTPPYVPNYASPPAVQYQAPVAAQIPPQPPQPPQPIWNPHIGQWVYPEPQQLTPEEYLTPIVGPDPGFLNPTSELSENNKITGGTTDKF